MRILNEDLHTVRAVAKSIQEAAQLKRVPTVTLNSYAVGDYVLFDEASKGFRDQKLRPRYSGPYLVLSVHKADITCSHMVTAKQKVFHMDNLKPFMGSTMDAYNAAKADDDQYVILEILDYRGEPEKRSDMEFLIVFEGNEKIWLRYNADLVSSAPFQHYCRLHAELEPITMTLREWKVRSVSYNNQGIVGVTPGQMCYVNLKSWGWGYFQSLQLPIGKIYVVECNYTKWTRGKKKIDLYCPLFNQHFEWNGTAVRLYGMISALSSNMVVVDTSFCQTYPRILE
jgi:hypothetical protein